METIKISVEVSVNLSENTQRFIKSLFGGVVPETHKDVAPETHKDAGHVDAGHKAKVAIASATDSTAPSKTIEEVREMLTKKVNEHREAIKQKLTELGAPSVTKLDPSKYDELYNFLNSL